MKLQSLTIDGLGDLEDQIAKTLKQVRMIRQAAERGDIPPSQAKKLLREAGIKISKP